MPEKVMKTLYHKILPQWRTCFLSAVLVGFAAHLYKIANWLPNWDSLVFRYDAQNMLRMGRWFLAAACSLGSFYDLPWINGLLAIIFHAVAAVCVCKIFDIKKGVTAALIGAVVISFPTVTSVMMYNYVADGYAISFMFACMAVMFLTGDKPNYVLAAGMITLSAAIYQAYITVAITLILLYLTDQLIFAKKQVSYLISKSVKFVLTGAVGMILYYLITSVLLKLTGETLLDYQGINSAMSLSEMDVWSSLYVVLHTTMDYFFDFSQGFRVFPILNCLIFVLTAGLYFISVFKQKIYMSFGRLLMLVVYAVLLPIGACVLAFINSGIDYHNLMKMGYCVFYMFFILLYERMDFLSPRARNIKSWLVLTLSVVLVWNQIIIANVSYHKLQMAYEKSFGTLVRIADRIEQTENSESCSNILVIGALPGSEAYSENLPPDMTGTTESYILRADDETVRQSVLCSALNDYCGKEYQFIAGQEKQELLKHDAIKNMSCWPEENSIAVIDNVLVIKLGEESEQ